MNQTASDPLQSLGSSAHPVLVLRHTQGIPGWGGRRWVRSCRPLRIQALWVLLSSSFAYAEVNYTWSVRSGDWMTSVDWSPAGGPPGVDDTAYIGNGATVSLNETGAIQGLALKNNSTLAGSGHLTTGTLDWSGGSHSGTGSTKVTIATHIGDGLSYSIQNLSGGRLLTLGGDSLFQSYRLDFNDASTLINTGTFASRGDVRGNLVTNNYINNFGSGSFINMGVYSQFSPGCATRIGTVFNNNNTVVISRGALELAGSGTHNRGLFNILDTGADGVDVPTLSFIGGIHQIVGGEIVNNGMMRIGGANVILDKASPYHGGGDVHVSNGSLVFNDTAGMGDGRLSITGGAMHANSSFSAGAAILGAGVLGGSGSLEVGTLQWGNGSMNGPGITMVSGDATMGDGVGYTNQVLGDQRSLHLAGRSVFRSYQIVAGTGSSITNNGVFTSFGDVRGTSVADNSISAIGFGQVFNNMGRYVQGSGSRATRISVAFNNPGEVGVESGRLVFNASFIMQGDASMLNLPVTCLINDSLDLNAAAMFDGTLNLRFSAFAPQVGDVIDVFTHNAASGKFDQIVATGLAPGLAVIPIYRADRLSVRVIANGYANWADVNGLTTGVNDDPAQDPDHDGIENLLEFALHGNPLGESTGILPAASLVGDHVVFAFPRNDESEAEVVLVFQYSTDLIHWSDVPVGGASSHLVDIAENGGLPDSVRIPIARQNHTTLFGRLIATRSNPQ